MSETKTKRFHRYVPEGPFVKFHRRIEAAHHRQFLEWRERIDARRVGSVVFNPEAK